MTACIVGWALHDADQAQHEEAVLQQRPAYRAVIPARHIVVVGSGRLARSLCHSLAGGSGPALVTVLARDGAAAASIARTSQVRASVTGAAVRFAAEQLADERATLGRLRPAVLVCVASAQSPYERSQAPSAWTDLIARAGFGVTLALQAELVVRLAGALVEVTPDTLLINGCFPDAVNPLLAELGLPVHCGLGNVATLAACLQAHLGLPDQRGLQILGHHAHLASPDDARATMAKHAVDRSTVDGSTVDENTVDENTVDSGAGDERPAEEIRVWRDGRSMAGVTAVLAGYRALPRTELNAIAGHAAARLVAAIVTGTVDLDTNLPGPLGLPGGYPVHLRGRDITLNLPAGLSEAEAVSWNTVAGHRDGVDVTGGQVSYPGRAQAVLAAYLPEIAAGWPVTALVEVSDRFIALRHELRTAQPVPAGTAD